MDLGSLLGGLADDPQGKGDGSADQLSDLLGSLLGGAQSGQPASGSQRNDGDEVLGSLSGSMGGQSSSGDPMGDLLGSLLGGAGGQGGAGDPMAGMMGGLLGGLLGGGMGGASANAGAAGGMNSALAPLANSLADKLGIPREMAVAALAIIVPMIMSKLMNSGKSGDPLGGAGSMSRQGLTFTPDEQKEMVQQLTAQTGMDEKDAAYTLNQAVGVLGGQ